MSNPQGESELHSQLLCVQYKGVLYSLRARRGLENAVSWVAELDLDSQVILTSYCVHTDRQVTHDHIAAAEAKITTSV